MDDQIDFRHHRNSLPKMVNSFLEFIDRDLFHFEVKGFRYKSQIAELKNFASEKRGVYVLSWQGEKIAYVGLAMQSFSKRVFSHFDKIPESELEFVDLVYWDKDKSPIEREFMFPSLEYYLIANTSPELNITYIDYGNGLVVMTDDCKPFDWFEHPY